MSEKKPDIDSLDFSKITAPVSVESVNQAVTTSEKPVLVEGAWIYGKHIKDVTPSEMKHWASSYLNRDFNEKYVDTVDKRSLMIDKIIDLYSILGYLGITRAFNKNPNTYIH